MNNNDIGPVFKFDEFTIVTAWGESWKVTILADKKTNGKAYAEAHIKRIAV